MNSHNKNNIFFISPTEKGENLLSNDVSFITFGSLVLLESMF